jgi:ParB family protein of integrating conjugative element (PFGI_1 class)
MARTPETLTAAQRAAELGITPKSTAKGTGAAPAKPDKHLQQARASLNLGLATRSPAAAADFPQHRIDPARDLDDSFALLSIDDIEPYQHNPRIGLNPRYDEIKASMKADGMTNALTVTRRPGALKYHPFGGGNTRLQIARELHEEGDQRFARLNVIVKEWRGDANVISAHLAENELRGDISFWEKAQGVTMLQSELQRDSGRVVTAVELNKALRAHGINFGIKTIQNFFFAIEHLAPVGPWLQARSVNDAIRPALAGAQAVAERFNQTTHAAMAVRTVLTRLAQALVAAEQYNECVDPEERRPVALDVAAMVDEIYREVASVLSVDAQELPVMVAALEADARLTAEGLRAIRVRSGQPTTETAGGHGTGHGTDQATGQAPAAASPQRSLPGMLGAVPLVQPGPTTAVTSAASVSGRVLAASPTPETPSAGPEPSPSASTMPGSPAAAAASPVASHPLAALAPMLLEVSDLTTLHDVLVQAPTMPFGYLMDMPKSLDEANGIPVSYPTLRAAAWKFLAGLSFQLSPPFYGQFSVEQSSWVAALSRGPQAFIQQYAEVFGARCDEFGNPEMGLGELQLMFAQPQLSKVLTSLLHEMERIRINHPDRFMPPGTPPNPLA